MSSKPEAVTLADRGGDLGFGGLGLIGYLQP